MKKSNNGSPMQNDHVDNHNCHKSIFNSSFVRDDKIEVKKRKEN